MKVYGTATVGSKGQIVIPADARQDLQLENGDKVFVLGLREGHMLGICPVSCMDNWMDTMQQQLHSMKDAIGSDKEEK